MKAKKKAKKNPAKAPKRRRFVAGLIAGKSMRRAALDAGYSAAMAKNAGRKIMPGAINEFKEALAKTVPQSKLIQRIAEGINAKKTIFAQFEGSFTDSRQLVDYSERRRYVELACKLFGFFNESAISKEEEAPVEFNLTVRFTDPDTKEVLPAALDEHGDPSTTTT